MLEIKDLTHWYGGREAGHLALDERVAPGRRGRAGQHRGRRPGAASPPCCAAWPGCITPASGSVTWTARLVDQVPDGLAVVFQDYSRSLLPWLSVQDNVASSVAATRRQAGRREDAGERREAAARALETVGLAGVRARYPWQLSGGMQQRVAIARALACDPVLLLMDEPFGSVDAQTREDLEDLILAVRRERDMTILLVTHDIDESVYVGDRVVVLTPGPGRVRADLPVVLPAPRDQISTRELPAFVHLRATVGRLVRSQEGQPAAT